MLVPIPEEIMSTPGPLDVLKEQGSLLSMAYIKDNKNYEDPEYSYCKECRKPYHSLRDDEPVNDWAV